MAIRIDDRENVQAHWEGFIDELVKALKIGNEQISFLGMDEEDIAEFEAFVQDSNTIEILAGMGQGITKENIAILQNSNYLDFEKHI